MDFRLDGQVLIACNCDWGCPCNFNGLPTRGDCEGGWIWVIDAGSVDGVPVDGLAIAVFADWPGAIHEGGGRAVAFLDERADVAQRDALSRLVRGEVGGPWAIFAGTYTMSEPEPARFDLDLSGYDTRARVGDRVELELDTIRNPVTGAQAHPEVILPEGIVTRHGMLAASRTFRVRGGVDYDHSGRYAAFGPFHYAA